MNKKILNGILLGAAGSFWWGLLGVFYFKKVSFAGPLELVVHRTIWTAFFWQLQPLFTLDGACLLIFEKRRINYLSFLYVVY